jgi:hypothetical protein
MQAMHMVHQTRGGLGILCTRRRLTHGDFALQSFRRQMSGQSIEEGVGCSEPLPGYCPGGYVSLLLLKS